MREISPGDKGSRSRELRNIDQFLSSGKNIALERERERERLLWYINI